MPWITDEALKAKLLDVLQKGEVETSGAWDTIITDANLAAEWDIKQALAARGYSASQISGWDGATVYNIDLALFWSLVKGGATKSYDRTFIEKLDRREELKTVAVTVGGVAVNPGAVASVSFGRLKEQDGEVFTAAKMDKW